MSFEFKLPDIGEGVTQGEVVKWLVKVGDAIKEDQPMVEIMTDKATVEIASTKSGTIEKLMAKDGDVVLVGKPLVLIQESGSAAHSKLEVSKPTAAPIAPSPTFTSSAAPIAVQAPGFSDASHVLASPATRKFARENGIDLSAVKGSGELGRVTLEDVEKAMTQPTRTSAPVSSAVSMPSPMASTKTIPSSVAIQSTAQDERIPLRGIRKKIAENMRLSKDHAAHFTHMDELDATGLVNIRNGLKEKALGYGLKLSYLPFIMKATSLALKQHPKLNASLDEVHQEIIIKGNINLGVAVATKDDDLIVPVIKNVDRKNILEIASEIKELAAKAQTNKLSTSELQGGTFTVTSLGTLAGTYATPIINYPEVGILGFYKIIERPVVRDGQIVIRPMATLSVSLDHRIVDGALGAKFTQTLIGFLEQPESMLLY